MKSRTIKNQLIGLSLFVLVLLGAGLRLHRLGAQSFWSDEASTWQSINQPYLSEVKAEVSREGQAPLGYLIMRAARNLTGTSEASLRFPEAVAGILTIPAMYLLGRRVFGYGEALLGAGLMTVLYVPLYYSQEARPYAWALLFSTLAMYYWFGCLQDVQQGAFPARREIAGYFIFGLLALYTHYVVALMLLWQALALGLVALRRGVLWQVAGLYLAFIPGYIFWLPEMIRHATGPSIHSWINPPWLEKAMRLFPWAFNVAPYREEVRWPYYLAVEFILIALLAYLIRSYRAQGRLRLPSTSEPLLVLAVLFPMAALYAYSHVFSPLWVDRYLIFVLPPLYLLAARGALTLARLLKNSFGVRAQAVIGAGLVVAFLADTLFVSDYTRVHKYQAREVAQAILQYRQEHPNSYSLGCGYSTNYRYYEERFGDVRITNGNQCRPEQVEEVIAALTDGGYSHLILSDIHGRVDKDTREALEDRYCLLDTVSYYGGTVWLFDVTASPGCN